MVNENEAVLSFEERERLSQEYSNTHPYEFLEKSEVKLTNKCFHDIREKARYWAVICYPENMVEDWETKIGDILGYPYAYCIHDKDEDKNGEHRKTHVHILIAYPNTTTGNSVWRLFSKLDCDEYHVCFSTIESVTSVRNMYEYLIHNTESSKKQNKHLYSVSERICGNNFDIGAFEQLSTADKEEIEIAIYDCIMDNEFTNFMDLCIYVRANYSKDYFKVLKANSGFYERVTRGMYQKLSGVLRNE